MKRIRKGRALESYRDGFSPSVSPFTPLIRGFRENIDSLLGLANTTMFVLLSSHLF